MDAIDRGHTTCRASSTASGLNPKASSALERMETPVVYFYTQKKAPVSLRADLPSGTITEWYPQAASTPNTGRSGGTIDWNLELMPGATPELPTHSLRIIISPRVRQMQRPSPCGYRNGEDALLSWSREFPQPAGGGVRARWTPGDSAQIRAYRLSPCCLKIAAER